MKSYLRTFACAKNFCLHVNKNLLSTNKNYIIGSFYNNNNGLKSFYHNSPKVHYENKYYSTEIKNVFHKKNCIRSISLFNKRQRYFSSLLENKEVEIKFEKMSTPDKILSIYFCGGCVIFIGTTLCYMFAPELLPHTFLDDPYDKFANITVASFLWHEIMYFVCSIFYPIPVLYYMVDFLIIKPINYLRKKRRSAEYESQNKKKMVELEQDVQRLKAIETDYHRLINNNKIIKTWRDDTE
jgi:hypothetical protein